jgi:phage baseplate assembly protein W
MASLASRNKVYSDLDLDFDIHPNTKQLNTLTSDDAVIRSLKNLIFTSHYERPFHPEIGCKIKNSLFDNIMPSTAITIQNSIKEVVDNFEPRIDLTSVEVVAVPDENAYHVTITFFIVNEPVSRQVTFFLERIR